MKTIDEILSDLNIEPEYFEISKEYGTSVYKDLMNDKFYTKERNEKEVEKCVLGFYNAYKWAKDQGFSPLWSKMYASHIYGNIEDEAREEAYSDLFELSLQPPFSETPQNQELIYKEAYNEYLRLSNNEDYARVYAYQLSQGEHLRKVKEFMKIFDKKLKEGKSIHFSRIYAENIVDEWSEKAAEFYAKCFEEAILMGQSEADAHGFANKKTDELFGE